MSKKIKVYASPNTVSSKTFTFEPSDHGFDDKAWDKLSSADKDDQVRQFLESLPEQPFWELDSYDE